MSVSQFVAGTICLIQGYLYGITNKATRRILYNWSLSLVKYILFAYAVVGLLAAIASPVLLALFLWSPSAVLQLVSIVHLLIFDFAVHQADVKPEALFQAASNSLAGASPPIPSVAKPNPTSSTTQTDHTISNLHRMWISFRQTFRATQRFLGFSLVLLLVSIVIPIGGSVIAFLGSIYLMAESLYFSLLSPYFASHTWGYTQRIAFFRQHRSQLMGFLLPSALLASIPVVGPFTLGLTQASVATLLQAISPTLLAEPAGLQS